MVEFLTVLPNFIATASFEGRAVSTIRVERYSKSTAAAAEERKMLIALESFSLKASLFSTPVAR